MGRLTVEAPQRPSLRRGNIFDQITLAILVCGSLFGVLGVATDNWRTTGKNIFQLSNDTSLMATKALAALGVACAIIALIIEIVIIVAPKLRTRPILIANFFVIIAATGAMLVACGIFGHRECGGADKITTIQGSFNNQCGFSYWFLVIGSVFCAEAFAFHYLAFRK